MKPTIDLDRISKRASVRVEQVRTVLGERRAEWAELAKLDPLNERWLRAFASGQILQPPAVRFLVIERYLIEKRAIPERV